MNQYDTAGGTAYTYDNNGNLTDDSTYTYTYDYENRLTSATKTGMSATYAYDPFGRRTQKDVDGTTTNYIYDGDQVIAETDATGNTIAKYTYGPGIDEPILMQRGGETYYYHFDGLGSVTAITDSSGTLTESYEYDIFGNITSSLSTVGNPYYFTGRRYDPETNLYYYRARYYSPSIGRFLQTDPVGYIAGLNLYTYVSNNPINWVDPLGFDKKKFSLWDEFWQSLYYDITGQDPTFVTYGLIESSKLTRKGWRSHLEFHRGVRRSFREGKLGEAAPYGILAGVETVGLGSLLATKAGMATVTAGATAVGGGASAGAAAVTIGAGVGWILIGAEIIWIGVDIMGGIVESMEEESDDNEE